MKIAIIEDEAKLRASLTEGLQGEGYAVDPFASGEEFEQAPQRRLTRYNLLILDLILPGKQGEEVCRTLRLKGVTTPILVLSARGSIADKVALFDAQVDDYLTKPFSYEELLARARALMRRPHELRSTKLAVRDVVLDANTRVVTRAGVELPLTSTEFDLLRLLLERRGQVIPREKISQYLWDIESPVGNVVDVHISNLRKKLDAKDEQEIVRTVRGAGYMVEA